MRHHALKINKESIVRSGAFSNTSKEDLLCSSQHKATHLSYLNTKTQIQLQDGWVVSFMYLHFFFFHTVLELNSIDSYMDIPEVFWEIMMIMINR